MLHEDRELFGHKAGIGGARPKRPKKYVSVRNATRLSNLSDRVRVADTFLERLVGLLAETPEWTHASEGLWIYPCSSIHTIGMKFPIDVLFLNRKGIVVGMQESLRPHRMTRVFPRASSVLEFPPETIARTKTQIGDRLEIRPLTF
jgi:uncharacterized protein